MRIERVVLKHHRDVAIFRLLIVDDFAVDANLATSDRDVYKRQVQQPQTRWGTEIGYQERELLEAFLRLPAPQRRVVREVILALVKAQEI